MSVLTRMEQQAFDLARLRPLSMRDVNDIPYSETAGGDGRVITAYDAMSDVMTLKGIQQSRDSAPAWARLINSGDPLNGTIQPGSGISGTMAEPVAESLAAFNYNATEAMAWTASTFTPIPVGAKGGSYFRLFMFATTTTTATASPTLIVNPRLSVVGGSSFGVSATISLTASITNAPLQIIFDLTIRQNGRTDGTAFGSGSIKGKFVTSANGAWDADHTFGNTAITGQDFQTAATSLWLGFSSAVTTTNLTVQQLLWLCRN